jgi:hypothetical protein
MANDVVWLMFMLVLAAFGGSLVGVYKLWSVLLRSVQPER